MARVPYVDPEDLPPDYRDALVSQRTRETLPPDLQHLMSDQQTRNFYRALGNVPPVAEAFRRIQNACWNGGDLSPTQREFVILAIARHNDSAYEWHSHVRIALDEGLLIDDIVAISRMDLDELDSDRRVLIRYALAVVENDVDDDLHAEMLESFDEATVVAVSMLAGTYHMNALVGEALGVDIEADEPWVGWDLDAVDLPGAYTGREDS